MVIVDRVLIPTKLWDYANASPTRTEFETRLNWYKTLGRMKPLQVTKMLDKFMNTLVHRVAIRHLKELKNMSLDDAYEKTTEWLNDYKKRKVMGDTVEKWIDIFKPLLAAYLDPVMVLKEVATRNPGVYEYIRTQNLIPIISYLIDKIRFDLGMLDNDMNLKKNMLHPYELSVVFETMARVREKRLEPYPSEPIGGYA